MTLSIFTRALGLGIFAAILVAAAGYSADTADARHRSRSAPDRTREISDAMRKANAPIVLEDERGLPPQARGDENRVPRLGDIKYWIALDDVAGEFYVKQFRLRGIGETAEVWVAVNLNFPEGDCRNDGERNVVTNAQIAYLLGEFDDNIRPIDTDWFGEPIKRTGKDAALPSFLPGAFGRGSNSYLNREGRDVVLVDNVIDDNFYDYNNANSLPRIAGFFTSAMTFFHDRNVITVDSYDWAHGTGPNPPNEPSNDPCLNKTANPFLYESVIAHEYQHLIHSDFDPDETNWVNEGLSMFAELLTGYSAPGRHIDELGYDSLLQSFLGWESVVHPEFNPIARPAGPENSLTAWEDQGALEVLADYGHAYYFMMYLQSRGYDQQFFTDFAHNELNGIEGLEDTLDDHGSSDTFYDLFNDMQLSALTDGYLDAGATMSGTSAATIQNDPTDATLYFSGDAYDTEGTPPWGSDFIPLGPGSALASVAFDGDEEFVFPGGPEWVMNGAYFSVIGELETQYANNLDVSIAHEVAVSGAGVLTFNHYYDTELDWDFGFVQVSDDGGATWTSLPCTGTTTQHDPGAIASIVANLPGYSGTAGSAGSPLPASCDLSAYSGENVIIAFRFMSDPSVQLTGWFVKDVQLDGVSVGTPGSLAGWENQNFYDPAELGYTIQFVGLNGTVDTYGDVTSATSVVVVRPSLDGDNDATLSAADLAALAGSAQVVAIISGVPEEEDRGLYSPYSLLVNGVEQADGQ